MNARALCDRGQAAEAVELLPLPVPHTVDADSLIAFDWLATRGRAFLMLDSLDRAADSFAMVRDIGASAAETAALTELEEFLSWKRGHP
jgi:hypothetical protein